MNDITEMTPEELRLEIAKAKGWTELHPHTTNPRKWQVLDGLEGKWPEHTFLVETPNWPTSITDAWELVEEASVDGVGFDLYTIHETNHYWYHGQFYDPPGGPMVEPYAAEEDTAPLAISKAYLAWKQGG